MPKSFFSKNLLIKKRDRSSTKLCSGSKPSLPTYLLVLKCSINLREDHPLNFFLTWLTQTWIPLPKFWTNKLLTKTIFLLVEILNKSTPLSWKRLLKSEESILNNTLINQEKMEKEINFIKLETLKIREETGAIMIWENMLQLLIWPLMILILPIGRFKTKLTTGILITMKRYQNCTNLITDQLIFW